MRQLRNHQRYWCLRALLDDLQLEMQASGRFVDEELVSLQRGRWRVLSAVKEGVQEERAWRTHLWRRRYRGLRGRPLSVATRDEDAMW